MEKAMKFQHIASACVIGAIGSVGVIALGAGTAAAAPTGPSAADTIARLQADGNRVVVNRVGTGPIDQCSVTSVRPVQSNPLPTGNPLTGVPNLQHGTTVHVGLDC
jgi:hypothetical protein